ncbi:hypothetical protein ACFWOT_28380 [Streptomyces sp. NPDC058440]|uniref:hypothetical protein n=1 Tax=Streptomyces sp. NPDC058440 TaxID=3346501 RepID=UPI00364DCE25
MSCIHRLLSMLLPASTEIIIPSFSTEQTRIVSLLDVTMRWSALATPALVTASALGGLRVPEATWWGVIGGVVVDGSVIRYRRVRRS